MNSEYALSGSNQGSMFSTLKNISGTQKIIAAFVVALVIIAIAYFVYNKYYGEKKAEAFMMPSTTMHQQVAHFPEAMTASEANVSCGINEAPEEEAYAWAQNEINTPGEAMTGRKTDNALSLVMQGY